MSANFLDRAPEQRVSRPARLAWGLACGVAFGFLLQKGGVAKFEVLIGALLLRDFTVFQVMLAAILVGMVGVHALHARGLVQLHVKPTRIAAHVLGGLVFGAGFALSAYCPGTGAAALGQGNYDALAMAAGMVAGSYLFAEASGWLARRVEPIGDRGKVTLPQLLSVRRATWLWGFGAFLVAALAVLRLGAAA